MSPQNGAKRGEEKPNSKVGGGWVKKRKHFLHGGTGFPRKGKKKRRKAKKIKQNKVKKS